MRRHEREGEERGESLSALLDGELSAGDRAAAVDRLLRNPELQARWSRYHAARAALEGSGPGRVGLDFAGRVRHALVDEPTVLAPSRAVPRARWLRPVAGLAIAASVALAALGGLLALQQERAPDTRGVPPELAEGGTGGVLSAGGTPDPAGLAPATLTEGSSPAAQAEFRRRLGVYLASHSEYAGTGEMPGMLPYTRFAGFNAGQ